MTRLRKLATVAAAIVLATWVAGPSVAAEQEAAEPKGAESRPAKQAVLHTIYGTVSAVEPGARTLEVKASRGKGEALVVGAKVTDHTLIREEKHSKNLADLKVGDHVWMKFQRVSTGDIARMIVIKSENRN